MAFKDYFAKYRELDVNDDVYLRQIKPEQDAESYYEILLDSDAFKYFGGYKNTSKEQALVMCKNELKFLQNATVCGWTIANKKSGTAFGKIRLDNFENNNTAANIGYYLKRDYWGKGIISACIKPVERFGFYDLKLERIFSEVAVDNIGSWKALEKNGFTREGLLRHSFMCKDGIYDCYVYSKLHTD